MDTGCGAPASGSGDGGVRRPPAPASARHRAPHFSPLASAPSRALVVAVGLLLVVAAAVGDHVTPPTLRFYVFYWLPIALIAWYAGRPWGCVAAVLSGLASALANGRAWAAAGTDIFLWNISVNIISFALFSLIVSKLRGLVTRERSVARTDFVTGLPNNRAFYEALGAELSRSRRARTAVSLAYLDVDDFKRLNDRFGHEAGDAALREIALTIRRAMRPSDLVARLGGDEFAILLPATGRPGAEVALDRLRTALQEEGTAERWQVSFSVGVVTSPSGECTANDLIRTADNLMYEVKQGGKRSARFELLDEPAGLGSDTPPR